MERDTYCGMQTINVLGVTLRSYSLKEALIQTDSFLKNGALNTIVNLSADMLVEAGKDEAYKEFLEEADMTVLDDKETRAALGLSLKGHGQEMETGIYFREFIHRNVREHNSFYLLTETAEQLQYLKQEIAAVSPRVLYAGNHIYTVGEKLENIMNDLNEAAPSVILSVLPFEEQFRFMREGPKYLNAEVWFAFQPEEILKKRHDTLTYRLRSKHSQRMLTKQLLQYEKTSTEV